MLTTKQRNLYIGIIAFCILASVLVFALRTRRVTPLGPGTPTLLEEPASATGSQSGAQPGVSVYPKSNTFDTGFFESSTFKLLKPFKPLTVDESELGIEDPFKPL